MIASLLFGFVYVLSCVGCFVGGVKMIVKGATPTERTFGLLVLLLGILGLVILF